MTVVVPVARPIALAVSEMVTGTDSMFDPVGLFFFGETGTFLDFTTTQVYADTAGTTPAAVGTGIAFVDDKSPNDVDATQATSTARPIFGRVPVGGRRNLLERTEEFDNAYWTKLNATVTANDIIAPDGTLTADKLLETTAVNVHRVQSGSFTPVAGSVYTSSIYVRGGLGRDWFALQFDFGGVNTTRWFDVANGVVGGTAGVGGDTASIEDAGGGWYRCSMSRAVTTSASGLIRPHIASADTTNNYAGDVSKGLYLWGAQIEEKTTATPYQKVVTQHDITEAGVPSIYKSFFDRSDDILPITLPTITGGTVALVGTSGIWIEENWDYAGGTLNIGPVTLPGLPVNTFSVVGDLCAVIINSRSWTTAEIAGVISWGTARGGGPNIVISPSIILDRSGTAILDRSSNVIELRNG